MLFSRFVDQLKTVIRLLFKQNGGEKRILLVLGGTWHDFDGFAAVMRPVLEGRGYVFEATYDLGVLARLHEGRYRLVLFYTCLGEQREDGTVQEGLADEQAIGLVEWVRGGGALLTVHAATVLGQSSPELKALMGGVFVSHPPRFVFPVYPCYGEHPITAGVQAFTVHDEFYVEACDDSVTLHMVAFDRGIAYPMVWSRHEGQGRVAHIAMGHDAEVWTLGLYQRLLLQAADWLTGGG